MAKFDIQHPGPKEFAIVGGGALAVILLWRWWSNRQASGTAANAAAAGTCYDSSGNPVPCAAAPQPYGGTTPTGLGLGALLLWIQDHASSSTTTKTTTTGSKPKPVPKPGTRKKMPDVVGQRANFAIGELKSCCGIVATTSPTRNPRLEYTVTGQTPAAGTEVVSGSRATLRVAQLKSPVKAA